MKKILFKLTYLFLYSTLGYSQTTYELVFYDEFNGNSLDLTKWNCSPWVGGSSSTVVNNLDKSINVSNGILSIITMKESPPLKVKTWNVFGPDTTVYFSSAYFNTKYNYRYGKFEASIKIPNNVAGINPAFWVFGHFPDITWNEIDFFEFMNNNTSDFKVTIHGSLCGGHQMCGVPISSDYDLSQVFHKYTGIWTQEDIYTYIDNLTIPLTHFHLSALPNTFCCFPITPMAIYLDAIPWNIPNSYPLQTSVMYIDYIKYYAIAYCTDLTITEATQYNYSSTDNFICGKSITINCPFSYDNKARLDVIGKTFVKLGPGFKVFANFSAKNDPNMNCQ
jgi:beta-glucanase (GH16 family)